MTIETDHKPTWRDGPASALERARNRFGAAQERARRATSRLGRWYERAADAIGPYLNPFGRLVNSSWLMRFMRRTLLRRIIASNLLGFVILLLGLTYLIQFNSWLIGAKIEHLRAQSHILAAAIASKASLADDLEEKADARSPGYDPLRDNPFAALEFSIKPEIVVPLLPTLLEKTNNRGRVYDTGGVLIADLAQILRPGSIIPIAPGGRLTGYKPKTENNWTRLTQWLMSSDLRVYKEIGRANGRFYPEVTEALAGKTTALMMLARKREKIVSVATPIVRGDEVRGVLLLSTAPGEIDDVQADELFAVLMLVLFATVASLLASFLLARTVGEPVKQLSAYAREVTHDIKAAKDLPRFDGREDEVGQLARSFTVMTRALYRRIEASEKFAADVAHELKNPLTAARSTAESLIYVKSDQQRDEFIEQIQIELKRLNKLISDVSDASRLDADLALQRFEPVDMVAMAESLLRTFQDLPVAESKHIKLVVAEATQRDAYVVGGQDGRLEQVLTNLLANALSFTPDGGTVTIKLKRLPKKVSMVVEDQGPGILTENIEKIFARFYTYRPTASSSRGDNSGLGLAISREIVEAHDGRIWAENIWPETTKDDGTEDGMETAGSAPPGRDVPPGKSPAEDGQAEKMTPLGARFVVRLPAADFGGQWKTRPFEWRTLNRASQAAQQSPDMGGLR